MKKNADSKKSLKLNKLTVKVLNANEVASAAGAGTSTCTGTSVCQPCNCVAEAE